MSEAMDVSLFVRAQRLRALLEANAIARLIAALDVMIEDADREASDDAVSEHCAESWRRRRAALLDEHRALVGELVQV